MTETGPPDYRPQPGSNAVGAFSIGASPVGTIPPFDWWRTVLSQYANSPRITSILESMFDSLDQTRNFDDFYDLIWNVLTAQGYGLDVWGRIVAINRVLRLGAGPKYFGFDEGYPDYEPFNTAPLYSGQKTTDNFLLSDDGFRVLILAKAFANICDDSIPSLNRLLNMLFGTSGRCYVIDNLNMTMTYKFDFKLNPFQRAILEQSGVMPKPTGVSYTIEDKP